MNGVSAEAEGTPLLEAVTGKRLVKTEKTEKTGDYFSDL
jgi:hypothetical protein